MKRLWCWIAGEHNFDFRALYGWEGGQPFMRCERCGHRRFPRVWIDPFRPVPKKGEK